VTLVVTLPVKDTADIKKTFKVRILISNYAFTSYALISSGWLVAALFVFVTMIHGSMKQEEVINER